VTAVERHGSGNGAGADPHATEAHLGKAQEAARLATVDRESVRADARRLDVELVGFASVDGLEAELPPEARPSTLGWGMKTFVVMAKRTLRGVSWARHLPSKQLAGGRNLRVLDLATETLARELERAGHASLPIASAALDFEHRGPLDLTPAGQGSPLLRHAAVAGGLGTWGLNLMVLTPELGPRVHFGGVMTSLEIEPDRRIETELCLGLEQCGRCAAVCPEDAIPRRAPVGAGPAAGRGLDCVKCARSSQPFGFHNFTEHMGQIVLGGDAREMWTRMRNRKTGEMWSEMAMMKEAALTGCSECVQVCPVGADYERIASTPHRRSDLPDPLPRTIANGIVEVPNLGPQVRRKTTWEKREKKS
jgi:epoxyqueuosine reductase QueG